MTRGEDLFPRSVRATAPTTIKERKIWPIVLIALVVCCCDAVRLFYFNQYVDIAIGILGLVYFGIYECRLQGELRAITGKGFRAWGHFWALIFTLGIYQTYWHYAAAKRLHQFHVKDKSVLYLSFSVFGCISGLVGLGWLVITHFSPVPLPLRILNTILSVIPFVIFILLQNDANKVARYFSNK
jgi:hypothetical protein